MPLLHLRYPTWWNILSPLYRITKHVHHLIIILYSTIIYQKSIFTNTKSQMYDGQLKIKISSQPCQWITEKNLSFPISIIPIIPNYTSIIMVQSKMGVSPIGSENQPQIVRHVPLKTHDYGRKSNQIVNCCFGAHPSGIWEISPWIPILQQQGGEISPIEFPQKHPSLYPIYPNYTLYTLYTLTIP